MNVLDGNRLFVAGEAICDIGTQTANGNTLKASLQQHSKHNLNNMHAILTLSLCYWQASA